MAEEAKVDSQSGERAAMDRHWALIADVLAGATRIRECGETYLPRYEDESAFEYNRRLAAAPWRPEFEDALRGLVAKPFGRDVALKDGAPQSARDLFEDLDGRGNNATVFAHEVFARGVSRGFHAVLVDYPSLNPRATRAEERAAGARPFFVHVPAESFLALYTRREGGREIVEHARFREDVVERVGFGEQVICKIRVLEPGRWELWRQDPQTKKWAREKVGLISRGSQRLQSVPLAFFRTGERLGELRVKPPLIELAQMQVELFRALSRQDEVLTFAGSPMLKARGMNPPPGDAPVPVGPRRVLWAPPSGTGTDAGPQPDWDYIQPAAQNIEQIRKHVDSVIDDMRRLGMQPMIQRTGTTTATGDKIEAARAHSALQAWAMGLKDCLEQAMVFAAEWTNEPTKAEVDVYTDFSAVPFAQAPLTELGAARERGDVSRKTYWSGLRRFDVLPADFDPAQEERLLAEEPKPPTAPQPPAN
jgi:hypothetical protein